MTVREFFKTRKKLDAPTRIYDKHKRMHFKCQNVWDYDILEKNVYTDFHGKKGYELVIDWIFNN